MLRRLSFVVVTGFLGWVGVGLVRPAEAAGSGPAVDVILSAGPRKEGATCSQNDQGTCDLVRVRLDLATGSPHVVETLVRADEVGERGSGASEAAVSPDGSRLVWLERVGHSSQLWAMELRERKKHLLIKSGPAREGGAGLRPEWPAWLGDSVLLFDAKTGQDGNTERKTVYSMDVAALAQPGKPRGRLGSGFSSGLGLEDVAVHQGADGARVVGFGPVSHDGRVTYPLAVQTLAADGRPTGSEARPALGVNRSGKPIESCHHPAWNPSGTEVTCMVHRPPERVGGVDTRLLYSFARVGDTWQNRGRTFEPITPEAAGLEVADRLSAAAGCKAVAYKFAQFCQSDTDLVATVFCGKEASASGRGAAIGASRVLLIHTDPVRYVDVTRIVERERGLPVDGLSAFTATCRAAD